jgi:hypothetical protein
MEIQNQTKIRINENAERQELTQTRIKTSFFSETSLSHSSTVKFHLLY